MFTTLFTMFYKPLLSLSMALSMAMTSTLTGPMGEFEKLANEAQTTDPARTETQIEIMVDLEAIAKAAGEEFDTSDIPEIPGVFKDGKIDAAATLYTYSDSEKSRFAISLAKTLDEGYAIYFDENGIALTPALVDSLFEIIAVFGEEPAMARDIYTEYFSDNGMYETWSSTFGIDETVYPVADESMIKMMEEIVNDVSVILTKEDNVKALCEIAKPLLDPLGKYYSKDGSSYTLKINGIQLIEYSADIMEVMYSEETANKVFDYLLGLVDDIDYLKYFEYYKTISGDESLAGLTIPEGMSNANIAMLVTTYLEGYRASFVEGYTSAYTEEAGELLDMVISGKSEDAEVAAMLNTLHPFLENSYIHSTIGKENGVITESVSIVIANADTTFADVKITTGVSEYTGVLPAAADVVPFDKRVEPEEIDNKIGFKNAREKGVHSVDLQWYAEMTPDDTAPVLEYPDFEVNYKSSMIESIKNDPEFATLTDEEKELVLGMFADSDHESKYCASTAHLIDGSVYLPLRQIMENCGYEVSWDGEARKAYVTVDGKKIEMTGVIVNDRTYVKIRDFEKLGATVDYKEEMITENAYNDFHKSCYVTITFAE